MPDKQKLSRNVEQKMFLGEQKCETKIFKGEVIKKHYVGVSDCLAMFWLRKVTNKEKRLVKIFNIIYSWFALVFEQINQDHNFVLVSNGFILELSMCQTLFKIGELCA